MTTNYLYRFRPIHAVLDGFHELEKQEIYFSSLKDLNDPLEGFKNIFWYGDEIVWCNFFRHYLLNLLQTILLISVMGEEFTEDICKTFIYQTDDDLPDAPIKDSSKRICKNFLENNVIKDLIIFLSSPDKKIRCDELEFYIRSIQLFAINTIFKELEQDNINLLEKRDTFEKIASQSIQNLNNIFNISKQATLTFDEIFIFLSHTTSQITLIDEFNSTIVDNKRPWIFILRDFPNFYITALEQLLYPNFYVSCFVSNPTDASMWGTYGDNHKGACLKFKTSEIQDKPSLDLYTAVGISGTKIQNEIKNETIYEYRPHYFDKIEYSGEFPEIDFFSSIGQLPTPKLDRFWYRSKDGKLSSKRLEIFNDIENWRKKYWENFSTSYKTKLSEWKHEQEYRLVLTSGIVNLEDIELRKLKYKFTDLAGIIFGIRTSNEDKLRIIKIIKDKCIAEKRDDFEFYQAYYSTKTKKVELHKLSLISFKQNN